MDDTAKLAIAVGAGLGLYYLLSPMVRKAEAQVPVQATSLEAAVMQYADTIWFTGVKRVLEPALIAAVIEVESGGNPIAAGAIDEVGLMQIRPETGLWQCNLSPFDLLNATKNIDCGTKYLKELLDGRNGDIAAAVASYNAGPGRVSYDIWTQELNMPAMTKKHVLKVLGAVPRYRVLFQAQYGAAYNRAFPPGSWNLSTAHLGSLSGVLSITYAGGAAWVN